LCDAIAVPSLDAAGLAAYAVIGAAKALSYGVARTYLETNLRYSMMAPISMFEEVNTGNNMPVEFSIMAAPGEHHADEFHLMFILKGGGSANKSFLYQQTRAVLRAGAQD